MRTPLSEEVIEFPPELDYDNVKFAFYDRIYGCSHKLDELTCHTEACPYSAQRIKGCGIQFWHVSPSRNDSGGETFEIHRESSSSSEDEAEYIDNLCVDDDYESLPSSEEEEDLNVNLADNEELNFSFFFEAEDNSDIFQLILL